MFYILSMYFFFYVDFVVFYVDFLISGKFTDYRQISVILIQDESCIIVLA